MRVVVNRRASATGVTATPRSTRPSRARATIQALGIGRPVLGVLGLALSLWIYAIPRFQDLAPLRGEVRRAEIVHPRRGARFALVTLAGGDVLHVQRVYAVKGAADAITALRPGDPVIAWIEPHEFERPHHHVVWQMVRGNESIVDFTDVIGPLEWERGRFRACCWFVTIGGVVCFLGGFGFVRRRA